MIPNTAQSVEGFVPFPADRAVPGLFGKSLPRERPHLYVYGTHGAPEAVKRVRIKAGEGICGWVAMHGEAQIVNDVRNDERHSRDLESDIGYHPRSVMCVPLRWEDGVGALELLNKSQGDADFTEDDLKLAAVIAGHVSSAIGLSRARERQELRGLERLVLH